MTVLNVGWIGLRGAPLSHLNIPRRVEFIGQSLSKTVDR